MYFEVKLRTGYFKTVKCNMIIVDNKIILSPMAEHHCDITIDDIDTLVISGIDNRSPHIEIQSHNSYYLCLIPESADMDELLSTMRRELNTSKTIIFNR